VRSETPHVTPFRSDVSVHAARCEAPRISTSLFTPVFAVVPTRRRRFLWAAWWTAPPEPEPFRSPDASSGGARSRAEARAAAVTLLEIEGRWAGAWARVLRGEPPWPKAREKASGAHARVPDAAPPHGSKTWALGLLGLTKDATTADVKRAFRAVALRTHPDHGGDDAAFIDAKRAHDIALAAAASPRRRARRR
jgi:hypothetical protein